MRITVDIDENTVAKVQAATGIRKKSPAIGKAVLSYVRDLERRQFLQRVREGKTDYRSTNDDLEAGVLYDAH